MKPPRFRVRTLMLTVLILSLVLGFLVMYERERRRMIALVLAERDAAVVRQALARTKQATPAPGDPTPVRSGIGR